MEDLSFTLEGMTRLTLVVARIIKRLHGAFSFVIRVRSEPGSLFHPVKSFSISDLAGNE